MILPVTILVAMLCGVAHADDSIQVPSGQAFTIKGQSGVKVRVVLMPRECLKVNLKKKTASIVNCYKTIGEPIVLTIGDPLTLGDTPHTFDLVAGIHQYTKNVGAQEYPVKLFSGVCVYIQDPSSTPAPKCGPIGGTLDLKY